MTCVVTQPCTGCKSKNCVDVCPCDSFHEGPDSLFINPESCIECDACLHECPVGAIFPDDQVPAEWNGYIELNQEMSALLPVATHG